MAELFIQLPDGKNARHKLSAGQQTIGRDAACEIPVDDPSASRRHARFSHGPAGYQIEDLGSKNGTLVNEAPCTSRLLHDGDEILIGSVRVVFRDAREPAPASVVIADDASTTHATRYASRETRLVLPQQRLQMIYDLSERLTTLQNPDVLFNEAMNICAETLHFERGAIGVRRKGQRVLDWPVVRNLRGAEGELTISRTLLNRALEHGERAIFTGSDQSTSDPTVSIVQHGIRSAMCVPLMHGDQILGVIYGDRLTTRTAYTQEDIDFLAGIARQVSIGVVNWQLLEEQRQMIRLNHDIDVARNIQTGLFPKALPNHDLVKVAAINDPGQKVSGDYYDVVELSDGRVWCLMADVAGEGVAASLLMANLQATVRATIEEHDDPAALLSRWNALICQSTTPARFITCLLALIDPKNRTVQIADAGHYPALLVRTASTCEPLRVEGSIPMGISSSTRYTCQSFSVGSEPYALVCYTDGVIEAMNTEGVQYSAQRLYDSLNRVNDLNPLSLVKLVRKSVTGFVGSAQQSDDITILAARIG